MFKRIREGLFGRAEDEQAAQQDSPEFTPAPPTPDNAPDDILPRQATPAAEAPTLAAPPPEDQVIHAEPVAPAEAPPATSTAGAPVASNPAPQPVLAGPLPEPPISASDASVSALPVDTAATDVEEDEFLDGQGAEEHTPRRGFLRNPFKFGLGRTRQVFGRMNEAFQADDITDDLWDELEETLITSDVGVQTTERLLATLRQRVQAEGLTRGSQLRDALKEELSIMLGDPEPLVFSDTSPITVLLVVGVNGVGKTTSIAKLANILKKQKHRVLLAAGDTFRAAATEQIKLWGDRLGIPVVSHQHGADPGAVVYDAMQAAQARGTDVLIVDTAGRLHTKFNLMEELKKIVKVLQKYDPEAPHEVLLVIDATTGQNGFLQAKQFVADAGVSGVLLTKLDGTARGGIAFAIAAELGLPIKYVGTGEKVGDFAPFDPDQFVDALFDEA